MLSSRLHHGIEALPKTYFSSTGHNHTVANDRDLVNLLFNCLEFKRRAHCSGTIRPNYNTIFAFDANKDRHELAIEDAVRLHLWILRIDS